MTLASVLIANRGEIAVRIARAAADHGLRSVAVYSDADAEALHARIADEAHRLPGTAPAETYMNIPALIETALRAGVDAVHPGYGFLAENAEFAAAVAEAGLTWIGPSAEVIEKLGNKVTAREIALSVDAPLAPGSDGPVEDWEEAHAFAEEHGLPIAIKAAYGGGGRGLKVVHELDDVEDAFAAAGREAVAAFGRGECFVEKFLVRPRHVEAQVLADAHGHTVVVGLRDCSLQRRNQKLVEEAPAPFLTAWQEATIRAGAVRICRAAGYVGAGTVEFLIAEDGTISFLEVNTRLQVEHPVTEMTTGVDLVGEQFRIAAGLPLSFADGDASDGNAAGGDSEITVPQLGHAIEFRLNAEDVANGYVPCPGTITRFEAPTGPGIRVDTGVTSGSTIPGAYDSMMAKLIVFGADRDQAITRARQALRELVIEGVATVVPFHQAVLEHSDFADDFAVHTTWIENGFAEQFERTEVFADQRNGQPLTRFGVELDGKRVELGLPAELLSRLASPAPSGASTGEAQPAGTTGADTETEASSTDNGADASGAEVTSPYAGSFVTWKVADGDAVEAGQTVAVIEAMKMESNVSAPSGGTIACESLDAGDSVSAGQVLARIS
ncbi:acetyl/propionyl/methylcrotonyl-CoA carboxylase subunit alpha [Brevibacterium luteolum]|uniref:acetyl/propionyl/methylcrotonyl-CoA carboxylase subunit alpha n=1 Tax=Brevibacterium luteolum TaxID=199591 RepID=UPI00223AB046|nr:biotin carboxylase N-terminal domain-containing protein [Brevibacterium luteolum]MCT1873604.1 ATP-grasp domain-containing protein [Brevibacterium luteolum]MCT1889799.1 ATP-grasp domain-containing protein [Brevibacterium luteolum]MCT1892404.1 ATP-grasp domain-containing protein [Brevibacterium luteolum]MCT1923303.1 ATP-grasp domain-containing protein [Brevibacterium luteolum]